MAQRITEAQLRSKIDNVNRLLGFEGSERGFVPGAPDGSLCYSSAYGGHSVHRYTGGNRGVSDLLGGHGPARELAMFLDGMREALYLAQKV